MPVKYRVYLQRSYVGEASMEVLADSPSEAEQVALNRAGDVVYDLKHILDTEVIEVKEEKV